MKPRPFSIKILSQSQLGRPRAGESSIPLSFNLSRITFAWEEREREGDRGNKTVIIISESIIIIYTVNLPFNKLTTYMAEKQMISNDVSSSKKKRILLFTQ